MSKKTTPLNPPLFIFKRCPNAAAHNAKILEEHNFQLDSIIKTQHPSQISYGSEFRSSIDLEELLRNHPLWPKLQDILDNGASFPLEPISDKDREEDLDFHSTRGNHKSTMKYFDIINNIVTEDIERGFALPLPLSILKKLPNASIAPLGCQKQSTIDDKGNIIPKYRMTHDQTFPGPSGLSVNLRIKKDLLPSILYSYVLCRSIHYIVNIRFKHPSTKIFICKVDLDAAFRRCTLASSTATESLTIFDNMLLMALRMTFGGSACPSLWGIISETLADLSNTLLHNSYWNHNDLYDDISNDLDCPICLPQSLPFHPAKELAVTLPNNDRGQVDIYIDDTIGITPDLHDNLCRMSRAIPLAIRTLARPLDSNDIIPRKDIISLKKFKAEGQMEEQKTVLGWILNTRTLKISLPSHKHHKWCLEIHRLIKSPKVKAKDIEAILGSLNHVACIYHPMRHFLGRIYQALYRASSSKGWTTLREAEILDFQTLVSFLNSAKEGISMNILTFRKPSQIYRSDSSEFGMGGYNITSGVAWRFEIPIDCRLRTSINSLEFIACIINIWVDVFHNTIDPESCLLSQTDSSSAAGWLRKSNFADKVDETVQLATARKAAELLIQSESCLYSQWFPGDQNSISDSLSRDFHIPPANLSSLLASHFPEQAPFGLTILPLPPDIVSWLTCLLLSQPRKEPWSKEQQRSKFALGLDSNPTYSPSDCSQIPTSTISTEPKKLKFSVPSLTPSEKADFVLKNTINPSSQTQSEPPWIAWLRPSSWLTEQTPGWTRTTNLHSFYNASSEVTHQQTTHLLHK